MKNIILYILLLASLIGNCKDEKDDKFLLLGGLALASQSSGSGVVNPTPENPGTGGESSTFDFSNKSLSMTMGTAGSFSPTVTGTITSCSISPALPSGLNLNTTTCVLSGTPTLPQSSTAYTVTATGSWGTSNVSVNITIGCPTNSVSVGGFCWFASTSGGSCSVACQAASANFSCMSGPIRTYSGDTGTDANCLSVLTALNVGTGAVVSNATANGVGCSNTFGRIRYNGDATTCNATAVNHFRACPCTFSPVM
jgi:hypothetical protein